MKKLLKQLVCFGLVIILSTSIVLATDEEESGGVGGNSIHPGTITEAAIEVTSE